MKHLLSLTLLLSASSFNVMAISTDQALKCAEDFIVSKFDSGSRMKIPSIDGHISLTPVMPVANGLHAFNISGGKGFVLVSAEGQTPVILGYSDKGSFNPSDIPPQLKGILESGMDVVVQTPSTRSGDYKEILHSTAEWGQGAPYNDLCPSIDGRKSPAGCVATAMAITMNYHNWPDHTDGGLETDFYYPNPTFDFSGYSIDWNVLGDRNSAGFAEESARLTLSAGVAAQMIYGPEESSAEVWPIGNRMVELFSYAEGCQYVERDKYSDVDWNVLLRTQLEEFGPVIYRGGSETGHCFVIDGCDAEGLYHVNWGWDGSLNGYFALDFSDIGGLSFGEGQGMVINIAPDRRHTEYSKAFIPNVDAYLSGAFGVEGWNFMKSDIVPGEDITFKMPTVCLNGLNGYINVAVVDKDDNILQLVGYNCGVGGSRLGCPFPGTDPELTFSFPELKEGERFQIVTNEAESWLDENGVYNCLPASEDLADWRLVTGSIRYPSSFRLEGNRSEVVDIKFHVDERLPAFFQVNELFTTHENEFTVKGLLGGCSPDNITAPKGVSLEVKAYDKEGNPKEPLYVESVTDDDGVWVLCYNISLYESSYEVFVKYDNNGDTRKDGIYGAEEIVEYDGLIYHIDGSEAELIGYDPMKLPDSVRIPNSIPCNEKEYPLMKIKREALLFAPATDLVINPNKRMAKGYHAFAGMEGLRSVSIEGDGFNWLDSRLYADFPFQGSNFKEVYFDAFPSQDLLELILGVSNGRKYKLDKKEMNFYISSLSSGCKDYEWTNAIYALDNISFGYGGDDTQISYTLPGLGISGQSSCLSELSFPVRFMWEYSLDSDNGLIAIGNVAENVEIEEVLINGVKAQMTEEGIYSVSDTDSEMEVTVNYTVNGHKKLSTTYSREYNKTVETTDLSGVDAVLDSSPRLKDVYSTQGILILSNATPVDIANLAPGIYIINGRKTVIK